MIAKFSHIVFMRSPNVLNVRPGTIYIDAMGETAVWLCPCGCGNISKIRIRKCKVFDPYEKYSLPENVAGYELSDDGAFSATAVFMNPKCPNGIVYGIENNKVILFLE